MCADLPVIVQWMILAGMGVLALLVVLLGMTWACSNAPATDRPYLSSNSAVSAMGMSISNCSLERLPAAQSIAKTMQLAFYEHMEAQLAGNPELSAPAAFGAAAVEHTLSYVVGSWLMYIIIHLRSNQTAYLSMLLMIAASVLSTSASIRKAASELKISQRTARLASRAASAIFFISISVSVLAAKQLGLDWATEVMLGSRWLAKLASLCAKFKKTLKAEDVLTARVSSSSFHLSDLCSKWYSSGHASPSIYLHI